MTSRFLALALVGAITAPVARAENCKYGNIQASAPDLRFIVNVAQGTVLDQQTGLMWKRCVEITPDVLPDADCPPIEKIDWLNWGEALKKAADSEHAGYKDWRLPNSKELESLVEVACHSPAINSNVFPENPKTIIWSSSPNNGNPDYAWIVNFYDGSTYNSHRANKHPVRLVRGGQ